MYIHLEGVGLDITEDLIKSKPSKEYTFTYSRRGNGYEEIQGYVELVNKKSSQNYLANKEININIKVSDVVCNVVKDGEEGSISNPYKIESIDDLVEVANNVNNGTDLYEGKYFEITRDLDFQSDASYEDLGLKEKLANTQGWTPIGTYYNRFKGNLLGNNHRIENILMKNGSRHGLFGYIHNSTIKDLTISGSVNSNADATGGLLIGVAYGNNLLENVHSEGSVSVVKSNATGEIGGIGG